MSGLTKPPLSMLDARGSTASDVRFDGEQVVVASDPSTTSKNVVSGSYDDVSGVVTLTFADGTNIQISGFMTPGSIGIGAPGPQGVSGTNGADGLLGIDGLQGPTGCQGPPGTPGSTGPQGTPGIQGPEGRPGPQGEKGDKGDTGFVAIYITAEDPGAAAGPGALWVKP